MEPGLSSRPVSSRDALVHRHTAGLLFFSLVVLVFFVLIIVF